MRWPFGRAGKSDASVDQVAKESAKAPVAEKPVSPLKSAFSSRPKESIVEERVTSSTPPQLGDLDLGALGRALLRKRMWVIVPTALSITAASYLTYTAIGAGIGRSAVGIAVRVSTTR